MNDVQVKPGVVVPADEVTITTARSGGPGGQHVNKTSSKVVVRFDLEATEVFSDVQKHRMKKKIPSRYLTKEGEVVVTSERFRDQSRNRSDAIEKFAKVLREGLKRPKTRIPTKPSRGAKARRRKAKEEKSQKKRRRSQKDW